MGKNLCTREAIAEVSSHAADAGTDHRVRALTTEEFYEILAIDSHAALMPYRAGYDMVHIHGMARI
jgi:2,4-dienoyl-CoA reductase-like NADH-dependent reductase (Old Yellow Enzyme family)